jgi:hypothetical protein
MHGPDYQIHSVTLRCRWQIPFRPCADHRSCRSAIVELYVAGRKPDDLDFTFTSGRLVAPAADYPDFAGARFTTELALSFQTGAGEFYRIGYKGSSYVGTFRRHGFLFTHSLIYDRGSISRFTRERKGKKGSLHKMYQATRDACRVSSTGLFECLTQPSPSNQMFASQEY